MARDCMHVFFQNLVYDPCTFENGVRFREYEYNSEQVDALFDKHLQQNKIHFAVMESERVIGDVYFKHIDRKSGSCELGIYLIHDGVKNKGYGTLAEMLALEHAFSVMNMETVTASALIKNIRSCRALEKAGFHRCDTDDVYHHYCCKRAVNVRNGRGTLFRITAEFRG